MLKQCLKLVSGKTSILNDPAHGKRLDGVMTRDGHQSFSVAHDDMFTVPNYPESGFFESPYCIEMVDAG